MPPTVPPSSQFEPRHILVRGVNWLGDAVMTTPALQRLRERFPQAHIALATPAKLADLWQLHSAVNEVISITPGSSPWAVSRIFRNSGFAARGPNLDQQNPGFDLAIIFPNSPRSALEPWLARIPRRLGYARPWRNWLLTDCIPARPDHVPMIKLSEKQVRQLVSKSPRFPHPIGTPTTNSHQTIEYLHLVAAAGADSTLTAPRVEICEKELTSVADRLASMTGRSGSKLWLGLNPSAAYGAAKCWPAENFVATARAISQKFPEVMWLLFGTKNDESQCSKVAAAVGNSVVNVAGKTSLRELMATLKLCRLLLTNDSGPMHLAAALGTPVIALFGSTSPQLTGPGLPGDSAHRLLQAGVACAPCFRRDCPIDLRCLTGITVETAVAAVTAVLTRPDRGL